MHSPAVRYRGAEKRFENTFHLVCSRDACRYLFANNWHKTALFASALLTTFGAESGRNCILLQGLSWTALFPQMGRTSRQSRCKFSREAVISVVFSPDIRVGAAILSTVSYYHPHWLTIRRQTLSMWLFLISILLPYRHLCQPARWWRLQKIGLADAKQLQLCHNGAIYEPVWIVLFWFSLEKITRAQ